MAFKEVNVSAQYRKLALWEKGDSYTGKFLSVKEGDYKGNPTYTAILETVVKPDFVDYKGNEIEVGGRLAFPLTAATMDYFDDSTVGNLFQLNYKGKVSNQAGTGDYHTFNILMDDESADSPVETIDDDDL